MTFNLKSYFEKIAAKNDKVLPTETRLRDKPAADIPEQISEAQLEKHRVDGEPQLMEKRLEKVRTGSTHTLTEGMLDSSKSKLVQHRNAEAHLGDINKLEEKRLANKPTENEKYEPANVTQKDGQYPHVKGKDGLQTADSKGRVVTSGRWDSTQVGEDFSIKTTDNPRDTSGITPSSLNEFEFEMPEIKDPETMGMIEDVTKGVELPGEEELAAVERDMPQETEAPIFEIGEERVVDAGGTKVSQVDIVFDPFIFNSDGEAMREALTFIKGKYRDLSVKQIKDSMVADWNEGKITLNLAAQPASSTPAPLPKPRRAA